VSSIEPAIPRVELLERDLDLLEGIEVAVEHPLEQVREKLEPVEPSRLARPACTLTEFVEHCDRSLVHRHHPTPRDETVDLDEFGVCVAMRRGERGHMQVRLAILEVRTRPAVFEPVSRVPAQIERLGQVLGATVERLVEVDPHDRGATQAVDVGRPIRDFLDLVALEQQSLHGVS
jgi:hypothetical protein